MNGVPSKLFFLYLFQVESWKFVLEFLTLAVIIKAIDYVTGVKLFCFYFVMQKINSELLSTARIKEEQECAWRLEKQVQAQEMQKQKKRLLIATCTNSIWEFPHSPFVLL